MYSYIGLCVCVCLSLEIVTSGAFCVMSSSSTSPSAFCSIIFNLFLGNINFEGCAKICYTGRRPGGVRIDDGYFT